eukprot:gene7199-8005_t
MTSSSLVRFSAFSILIFLLSELTVLARTQQSFNFTVPEEQPSGTLVANLGPASYNILSVTSITFEFTNTGDLKTKRRFDRETGDSLFEIIATRLVSNGQTELLKISVYVQDINDNTPSFPSGTVTKNMPESDPVGRKYSLQMAQDKDFGNNGTLTYKIVSGNSEGRFFARHVSGEMPSLDLVVNKTLDRETTSSYNLNLSACDHGHPRLCGYVIVKVIIDDVNDNAPLFNPTQYTGNITENSNIGTSILQVHATDPDLGTYGQVKYSVDSTTDALRRFSIGETSGIISNNVKLDYEVAKEYRIRVIASDADAISPKRSFAHIKIHVLDQNDNIPEVKIKYFQEGTTQVLENAPVGTGIARLSISDKDSGINAKVVVKLNNNHEYLRLESESENAYIVTVNKTIDREVLPGSQISINVIVSDKGQPPNTIQKTFSVNIGDVNDNAPRFLNAPYASSVNESTIMGPVFTVKAEDKDLGTNAQVVYSIIADSLYSSWFTIAPTSGIISATNRIDRETSSNVVLKINAKDLGNPSKDANTTITFTILDANDNPPSFMQAVYTFSVQENSTLSQNIGTVSATDVDTSLFLPITYSISSSSYFRINRQTGLITTSHLFDREVKNVYDFKVFATDIGGLKGNTTVRVSILDINDNNPFFSPTSYNISVHENTPIGIPVVQVKAKDIDIGDNAAIVYNLSSCNPCNNFAINPATGGLYPTVQLNYQARRTYTFLISARDSKGLPAINTARVTVHVLPAVHIAPKFESDTYTFRYAESDVIGAFVGKVVAKRDNFGVGELFDYSFVNGIYGSAFKVNRSGIITTDKIIDYEARRNYTAVIQAKIIGSDLTANATVNIIIIDLNDNVPTFNASSLTISLKEGVPLGYSVFTAYAPDKDSGTNGAVTYSFKDQSSSFKIDAKFGVITTKNLIDYESVKFFELRVIAVDNGTPRHNASLLLKINIRDVNDNPPQFSQASYFANVAENAAIHTRFFTLNVSDVDSGVNGKFDLSFKSNSYANMFSITNNGEIRVAKELDRETKPDYSFVIVAKDRGYPPHTAEAKLTIIIADVNDNRPLFGVSSYLFTVCEEQPAGTPVQTVTAVDKDEGSNGIVTYKFQPANSHFKINSVTGAIKTKVTIDREKSRSIYNLFVNATDGGSPGKSNLVEVKITVCDINDNAPVFTTKPPYTASISKNTASGTHIIQARATDKDLHSAASIEYSLLGTFPGEKESVQKFSIDPTTGWIKTNADFQTDSKTLHKFTVVAKDKGMPQRVNVKKVLVFLLAGDRIPLLFDLYDKTVIISEATSINTTIYTATVAAANQGPGKVWRFSIVQGNSANSFRLNQATGALQVGSRLSYESSSHFQLKLQVIDVNGVDTRRGVMYVNIFLLDRNLRSPVFASNPIILGFKENLAVGSSVHQALATDVDYEDNGRVIYSLISQSPGRPIFNINPFNGQITTTEPLDREKVSEWTIILQAEDTAVTHDVSVRRSATATIKLLVFDVNDNKPMFVSSNYTYMMEDERVGYPVKRIVANDADQGSNARIVYRISSGNSLGKFAIDSSTGQISLAKKLAYNEQSSYTLIISASDRGTPALSNTQQLKIEIIDVNNNSPKFAMRKFTGSVTEGSAVGTQVIQVTATDLDSGTNSQIIYSLESNSHFAIDKSTGWISTKAEIDREQWPSYQLSLSADNDVWPFHSDTAIVEITVNDVNDCPPVFVDGASINLTVFENRQPEPIHRFVASDCDSGTNAVVQYSIIKDDTSTFTLNADAVNAGLLYTNRKLDRETISSYEIIVQARNTAPPYQTVTQTAKIWVGDTNDNKPIFTKELYSKIIPENSGLNVSVLTVHATDRDAGLNGRVVYSVVKNNKSLIPFNIDPVSGKIYVDGQLDYETQSKYTFQVKASDMPPYGVLRSLVKVQINLTDVNDNAPKFTSQIFEGNTTGPIRVKATDADSGSNGEVRYRFVKSSSLFTINSRTGRVTFLSSSSGRYELDVEAYDLGTPSLSSFATLIINKGSHSSLMPRFLNKSASVNIPENSPLNTEVGKIVARSSSSAIKYSIESTSQSHSGSSAAFRIDQATGMIYVNNPFLLDYEQVKAFEVVVRASIIGNDSLSAYEKLRINLTDVNDNSPVIYPRNDEISLPEALEGETHVDYFVKAFTATDADSGNNGRVEPLSIISGNEDGIFGIGHNLLILKKNLDYETKRVHKLTIQAKDKGVPPRYRSTRLTVHVIDKNDNAPVFQTYAVQKISEAARPGLLICIVKAVDPDRSSTIKYSLKSDGLAEQFFYIDQTQGLIKLLKKLDYETTKLYKLVIYATDGKHTSNMTLTVQVEDANDNAPVFSQPGYVVYLPKIIDPNHVIIDLNATDKDSGVFGKIKYSIPYPPIDAFLIDQSSGVITATKQIVLNNLNRPYELLVFANDGGQPQLQTQARVHLRVKDPNYTGPKFDKAIYPKTKRVFEDIPIGALIQTVSVTEKSEIPGMQIEYSIQAGNEDNRFYIDPLYGKIQLVKMLDRENVSRYTIVVRATDKGVPPQFDLATVHVIVVDANDNSPVFEKAEYVVSVFENVTQDTRLLTVNATDADDPDPRIGNGIIAKYGISSGNSLNWFEINSKGVLTLIRLLDRESKAVHRLTVKATDNGQPNVRTGYTSVIIKLKDVNDNRPEFAIPNIKDLVVLENSPKGKHVFNATAEDRDEGQNGLVTYSIIDGNGRDYFEINNATGLVTTKDKVIDYEQQNLYKLRILAVDHGTPPLSSSFEYRIAVKDVNEYSPQFTKNRFEFNIRANATIGTIIGQVTATDQDGGAWGQIRYSLVDSSKKVNQIGINSATGHIHLKVDLRKVDTSRRKRRSTDANVLSFIVKADNGDTSTFSQSVPLSINVDYTCKGCEKIKQTEDPKGGGLTGTTLYLVVALGAVIAILIICFFIYAIRQRRRRENKDKANDKRETQDSDSKYDNPSSGTQNVDLNPPDILDGFYNGLFKQPSIGASSGRGSSESQLIANSSHRPSFTATDNGSTHSFVVYHDNKPVLDSGIVDFDRLSDVTISDIAPSSELQYAHKAEVASSVGSSYGRKHDVSSSLSRKLKKGVASSTQSESHVSLNDFMDEGGGEEAGRLDFGNLLYTKLSEMDADEQEAVMDGTRPFTDEGIPSGGGSLSTIVGSDEELRGNYNYDYLLDWGPQFKPLATVFSEIAKVKSSDGSEQRSMDMLSRAQVLNKNGVPVKPVGMMPHQEPIPLQTMASKTGETHPKSIDSKLGSLKANNNRRDFVSNRTSMLSSMSSLPRSPISANSSYTSGPLSPNFTPAITPLITRSPSVSPLDTPAVASPLGSKPESVLDIAEKSRKTREPRPSQRSEHRVPSDQNSEWLVVVPTALVRTAKGAIRNYQFYQELSEFTKSFMVVGDVKNWLPPILNITERPGPRIPPKDLVLEHLPDCMLSWRWYCKEEDTPTSSAVAKRPGPRGVLLEYLVSCGLRETGSTDSLVCYVGTFWVVFSIPMLVVNRK